MKEKHYLVKYYDVVAICTYRDDGWYIIKKTIKHDKLLTHYSHEGARIPDTCRNRISTYDSFEEALEMLCWKSYERICHL